MGVVTEVYGLSPVLSLKLMTTFCINAGLAIAESCMVGGPECTIIKFNSRYAIRVSNHKCRLVCLDHQYTGFA